MTLHQVALTTLLGVGMLVASLGLAVMILLSLPAAHFTEVRHPFLESVHSALRIPLLVVKNLLGVGVIAAGIVMSIPGVPGQGFLTVFIGLMLVDFPGKVRLERAIIRRPAVHGFVNRLRRRFGRPPLLVP